MSEATTVKISKTTHKRIKLLAVQTDRKVEETVEQLLSLGLEQSVGQAPPFFVQQEAA